MKIKSLVLENFRRYHNRCLINFADFTAFIGRNDVGKSTILEAIDIFFEQTKPDSGDGCVNGDRKKVRIGIIFSDLPDELNLDRGARSTLRAEHLLNPDGDLEIHKVFNLNVQSPKAAEVFAIAEHPTADGFGDLLQKQNADLKKLVKELDVEADCNQTENPSMRQAIYAIAGDLKLSKCEVPLNENNGKTVWSALQKSLPVFALFRSDRSSSDQDPEVQNPMKAAVKKALAEISSELDAITSEVQKRVEDTANRTVEQLQANYPDLASTLTPLFRPPAWQNVFKVDLESDEGVPLNKRGSGIRRLVLLSFFQAEAEKKREERLSDGEDRISVVYAIEEPETSQHPENQERIVEALKDLAESGEQVIVTTHVPALAGLMPVDGLRYVDSDPSTNEPRIRQGSPDIYSEVARALGVLPDPIRNSTARVAVLVEGKTDIYAIISFAQVLASEGAVEALDDSKIFWASGGGDTLKDWVERDYLHSLKLPQVVIFDSDKTSSQLPASADKQNRVRRINAYEDRSAFMTRKREIENYVDLSALNRLCENKLVFPDGFDPDYSDLPLMFGKELRGAIENRRLTFEATDHNGERIPPRKSNAKKILTSFVMRNMTADEIRTRSAYDHDGTERYEVIEWIEAITGFCAK